MAVICPLCGAGTTVIHEVRGRRFDHCPTCDLVSVPPLCHSSAKDQRARYAMHCNSLVDAGYVQMLKHPIALLRQYGGGVRRVLDYGSGPAPVLVELLQQAGYQAVGYDPFFSSETDLSSSFDAVISVETFEHFADPRCEIDKIRGLLRPDGWLIVMTLFHKGPATIRDWWYARDPTHVAFYSSKTVDWIASQLGFKLLYCDNERLAVLQHAEGPRQKRL